MRNMVELRMAPTSTGDLTAKARIRNAALSLYAAYGEDATSIRAIASEAGVTGGLVVHHFGTKDGLRRAVEDHIVGLFAQTIEQIDALPDTPHIPQARDEAVARMLEDNPPVVGYLRRALLDDAGHRGQLLARLTELTTRYVTELRSVGLASTTPPVVNQVIGVLVRQLGHLFLQPLVDQTWTQLADLESPGDAKPNLVIKVVDPADSGR